MGINDLITSILALAAGLPVGQFDALRSALGELRELADNLKDGLSRTTKRADEAEEQANRMDQESFAWRESTIKLERATKENYRDLCDLREQVKYLERQRTDLADHARNLEGQRDALWDHTLKAAEDRRKLTARAHKAEGRVADLEGVVHDLESACLDAMRRAVKAEKVCTEGSAILRLCQGMRSETARRAEDELKAEKGIMSKMDATLRQALADAMEAEAELVTLRGILIKNASGRDSGMTAESLLKELATDDTDVRRWLVRMGTSDIANHKLAVIRAVRTLTKKDGMGLKEAKDLVDGLLVGDADKMATVPIQLNSANALKFLEIISESGVNLDMVCIEDAFHEPVLVRAGDIEPVPAPGDMFVEEGTTAEIEIRACDCSSKGWPKSDHCGAHVSNGFVCWRPKGGWLHSGTLRRAKKGPCYRTTLGRRA